MQVRQAIDLAVDRGDDRTGLPRLRHARRLAPPPPLRAPVHVGGGARTGSMSTKANQLLDGLGFAKGSDGIRVADGVKMEYTVLVGSGLRNRHASWGS